MLKLDMSYLIIGGTPEDQKKKICQLISVKKNSLTSNNPNLLTIEPEKSIGIDRIREIKKFVSKKSWNSQKRKLVIVSQAEAMTKEAQNAFLKTLEEPPPNTMIIITANNQNALLPTFLSRCQIISLQNTQTKSETKLNEYWNQWKKISESNLDKRLRISKKLDSNDLDNYILCLQHKLIEKKSNKVEIKNWLENIVTAKQMLEDNVNSTRVFDWLMLKL